MRRYQIPSTSALTAFEAAARHCNFSEAARELNTSQSAISRHILDLEARYNTQLFIREGRKLSLSEEGSHLHRAIHTGFDSIQAALHTVRNGFGRNQVTIACTHEISHLYIMPRYEALQEHLGDQIQIRMMTYEYDVLATGFDPRLDLMFLYAKPEEIASDLHQGIVIQDACVPVCSPEYCDENRIMIEAGPEGWQKLKFLNLTKRNQGWATWQDWFQSAQVAPPKIPIPEDMPRFDNYVYLLEAAASGRGIALGWNGLVDRYFEQGTLKPISEHQYRSNRALYAILTRRGQNHDHAQAALRFLVG